MNLFTPMFVSIFLEELFAPPAGECCTDLLSNQQPEQILGTQHVERLLL